MSLPRVLVVEDEVAHSLIVKKALEKQFAVTVALGYNEGQKQIQAGEFDVVLLDIMLDEADGFQLCTQIKNSEHLKLKPIVFLTSRAEVSSKVIGFSLGADDYIVKPCDPEELRARVWAKFRRTQEMQKPGQPIKIADLIFHLERQTAEIEETPGHPVSLEFTPLEFKLLYFLASHKEQVLSRQLILENVWGKTINVLDRTVDTFIAALRKKLEERGRYIRSVHGVGYKFTTETQQKKSA